MTFTEVADVLERVTDERVQTALQTGMLTSMSSGSALPVMDLDAVSDEFVSGTLAERLATSGGHR